MRSIQFLVIHRSGSDEISDDSLDAILHLHTANKKTRVSWAKSHVNGQGLSDLRYHFFITKDGKVHEGRPVKKKGVHTKDYNKTSIGICLSGHSEFTEKQYQSLRDLVSKLLSNYGLSRIDVIGHNDLEKGKGCPGFDVQNVLRGLNGKDNI